MTIYIYKGGRVAIWKIVSLLSVFIFGLFLLDFDIYHKSTIAINEGGLPFVELNMLRLYRIILGAVGSVIVLLAIKFMYDSFLSRIKSINILLAPGKNTLGIYIVQTFFLELLLAKYINIAEYSDLVYNIIVTPLLSGVIVIICFFLVKLIGRFDYLRFFMFGKKLYVEDNHK